MQVILKRVWFVGGSRYKSIGKSAVEIPDKFRDILPKDAVEVDRSEVPVKDAPEVISGSMFAEAPDISYVNPAHALDAERQFAEALSAVNKDAKTEVDSLRDKIKKPKPR